jgi:hypothetical protein
VIYDWARVLDSDVARSVRHRRENDRPFPEEQQFKVDEFKVRRKQLIGLESLENQVRQLSLKLPSVPTVGRERRNSAIRVAAVSSEQSPE